MVFVETPTFTKLVLQLMDDASYSTLQVFLAEHPDAGDVIKGSGGIRKLLGRQRTRQTRWLTRDLLLVGGERPDIDAAGVS